jgi:hypothetical protein
MVKRVILAFLFLPFTAQAEEGVADKPNVSVTQLCRELVPHQPDADVNYKPGTDQFGREVVPADLDGGAGIIEIPETVLVNLTVDQANILGLPANIPYKPEAYIGEVQVTTADGSVYFNGKRISQPQIQALCDEGKP